MSAPAPTCWDHAVALTRKHGRQQQAWQAQAEPGLWRRAVVINDDGSVTCQTCRTTFPTEALWRGHHCTG